MCDNCGTTTGPFYKTMTPQVGRSLRVCGPVTYDDKGRLTLRSAECAARRKKWEDDTYGKEDYRS